MVLLSEPLAGQGKANGLKLAVFFLHPICHRLIVDLDMGQEIAWMYFNDQLPEKIIKYGVGKITSKGRAHLVASVGTGHQIQLHCVSGKVALGDSFKGSIRWFDSEFRAVGYFCKHKNACQKCMRLVETVELGLQAGSSAFGGTAF